LEGRNGAVIDDENVSRYPCLKKVGKRRRSQRGDLMTAEGYRRRGVRRGETDKGPPYRKIVG